MNKQKKILIIRLSAIGDVVHTLPLASAIKNSDKESYIGWAVEDVSQDLIINNPLIDKYYVFPKKQWKKRGFCLQNIKEFFEIIREIRKDNYDIVIDTQELLKSAIIMGLSGCKRKVTHAKTRELAHLFANEKIKSKNLFDPNYHVIDRHLEFAKYIGYNTENAGFELPPSQENTIQKVDELLLNLDKSKPTIILSPATIWPSKHWVEGYWSEILDEFAQNCNVIFTGTSKDIELINRITAGANTSNFTVLAGKTDIKELIEVLKRSDIVIAPDTGPVHIAAATNKPFVISIFGSTSAKRTGAWGANHCSITENLNCQPCHTRNCPLKYDKMKCMLALKPSKVINIVKKHLQSL